MSTGVFSLPEFICKTLKKTGLVGLSPRVGIANLQATARGLKCSSPSRRRAC